MPGAGLLPPVLIRFMGDTGNLVKGISESEGRLGALTKVVSTFGKLSAIALAGAAAESVHLASDFQKTMLLTRTQAGDTTDNLNKMSEAVLKLAPQVGQGPEQLAEGLYHVASVGYRGADALDILRVAAEGAKIGNANLDDTTYALTSTMNAFAMKGAGGAAQMMAQLNAIVGSGDMKMGDLNDAIKNGLFATSQTFGVSIQSAGAALAYLTDRGQTAATASTQLTMAMTLMAAPTAKASKLLGAIGMQGPEVKAATGAMTDALQKAGLSTVTLADDLKKPNGIFVALTDLKTHLVDSGLSADAANALIARAFGGGKTDKAIVSLIANLDALNGKYQAIGAGAKNFGTDWADTQKTFSFQWDKLKSTLQALGIRIGLWLIPILEGLAKWFSAHPNITKGLIIALGALMAISIAVWIYGVAAALVEATIAVGGLTVALLANPITWIVLAIVAAIALVVVGIYELVKHWKGFTHGMEIAWHATLGALETAWHATVGALETAWRAVAGAFVTAWHAVSGALTTAWRATGGALVTAWRATVGAVETVWRAVAGALLAAWHAVAGALETAWRVTSGAFVAVWHAVEHAVEAAWRFILPILRVIGTAINILLIPLRLVALFWIIQFRLVEKATLWLWHNALAPFFTWITHVILTVVGTVLRWLATAWRTTWNAMATATMWLWRNVLAPFGNAVSAIVRVVIGTAIRWLEIAWRATVGAIATANRALELAFTVTVHAIEAALHWVWNSVIKPVFQWIANAVTTVVIGSLHLLESAWHAVWGAIEGAARWTWNNVLSPTFHAIGGAFDAVIGAALRGLKTTWDTIWGGIKTTVSTVWSWMKPIFDAIGKGIGAIGSAVSKAGGFIGTVNKVLPFAEGGSPPVGRAVLVGEQGPELAVFGGPAYIHPAGETRSLLAGGKASGGWVGSSSSWGGSAGAGTITVIVQQPDIVLNGQKVFRGVQQEALRYNRRNPTNGLARVAGL